MIENIIIPVASATGVTFIVGSIATISAIATIGVVFYKAQQKEQNKINALFEGFIRDFANYKNIEVQYLRTSILNLNPNDISGIFNALQAHNLALPIGEAPPAYL